MSNRQTFTKTCTLVTENYCNNNRKSGLRKLGLSCWQKRVNRKKFDQFVHENAHFQQGLHLMLDLDTESENNASLLPETPLLTRICKAGRLRMQTVMRYGLRLHRHRQIELASLSVAIQGVRLSKKEQVQHILLCLWEICFRGNLIRQIVPNASAGRSW